MKVEIIPQAQQDVAAAARDYQTQRAGLELEFLEEFERGVVEITARPAMFEQIRPSIRRYLLERFPYGIYYRTPDENTVRIIIVRHHSRRPTLGMRRK
jgi:plasmid stabilization system protein ParE